MMIAAAIGAATGCEVDWHRIAWPKYTEWWYREPTAVGIQTSRCSHPHEPSDRETVRRYLLGQCRSESFLT